VPRVTPAVEASKRLASLTPGAALDAEGDKLERGVPVIPTGFPRLDSAIGGGFPVPALVVLGAAPKSGKSIWSQIITTRHVQAGGAAYVLDLENGRRRYFRRLTSRLAGSGPNDTRKWAAAKERVRALGRGLWVEFAPPKDGTPGALAARLRDVKAAAGDRRLLVVVDSLQKLPGSLEDRRATIDGWIRFFERLRLELDAVFLLISEIRRGKDGYAPREDAFKESSGVEYGADLGLTLDRPSADEEAEGVSTLRVQFARDCDEDPRGDVASYAPVRPFYDLEERDPVKRKQTARRGPRPTKRGEAEDFLRNVLAAGPVDTADVKRRADDAEIALPTLQRARENLGVVTDGKRWRLP
jgi:KaiC/GvpD/RAD55 family RecA-like ATPase